MLQKVLQITAGGILPNLWGQCYPKSLQENYKSIFHTSIDAKNLKNKHIYEQETWSSKVVLVAEVIFQLNQLRTPKIQVEFRRQLWILLANLIFNLILQTDCKYFVNIMKLEIISFM